MPRKPHGIDTAFCKHCDKQVKVLWDDCGIGSYEYWGAKGNDVDWRAFCSECEEQLDSREIEVDDREPDFNEDDPREDR